MPTAASPRRAAPARAGAAAAARAHDRGFRRAGRGRGGRRDRGRPDRARAWRRRRRSRRIGSISSAATARSAPSSARDLARRWAAQVASSDRPQAATARSSSTGVMLAFAFPDRVARNRGNGSFVLANGRGAAVEQTSSLARAPYIAVGELTGTAANGPHPAGGADLAGRDRARFADQIETDGRDQLRPRRAWRCARARKRTLHAITLSEAPLALSPSAETAASSPTARRRRPRQAAVVESR